MHYKTVIIDSDNWALASSEHKAVLHWAIKDQPWLNVRTFSLDTDIERYPVQLKTVSWRDAQINTDARPDNKIAINSLLLSARVRLFNELVMRMQIARENLGISDQHETLIMFHEYLAAQGVVPGDSRTDSVITFQNRLKSLSDLENVKQKVVELGLQAKSREAFDACRQEMERLFFTNILL